MAEYWFLHFFYIIFVLLPRMECTIMYVQCNNMYILKLNMILYIIINTYNCE